MRDYEKKLTDSLLVQVRYERKYIITKDKELHNQFMLSEKEVQSIHSMRRLPLQILHIKGGISQDKGLL